MEQVLVLPEWEVFQATPIEVHRKYWQDDDIWGVINSYPHSIRKGFEKLKEAIHQYMANGYSNRIQGQYSFDEDFLRKFCHSIFETETLEKSFAKAGGIKHEFGLEWGKLKILQYYRKFLKNPASGTGFFYYFKRDCKQGSLKQFNISCWGDLLEFSLQDHTFFQRQRQNFTGDIGLQRAKEYLQKQYKLNGKIPMSYDNGCKFIANAIRRNFWEDFGITTWCDLIYEVFGLVKGTFNLWTGSSGLDRALSWIKEYVNEHGKLPSGNSAHYHSIHPLISKKIWKKYGINSWNDLTIKACGIVKSKKKRKWVRKKGLERAKKELKEYFNEYRKLPTASMFPNLSSVFKRGNWKEFNVSSWNDLLKDTFGRVNVIHGTWMGRVGLNRAKKSLIKYKKEHKKYPKENNRHFRGIKRALIGKYWIEFGIFTWDNLIQNIF